MAHLKNAEMTHLYMSDSSMLIFVLDKGWKYYAAQVYNDGRIIDKRYIYQYNLELSCNALRYLLKPLSLRFYKCIKV